MTETVILNETYLTKEYISRKKLTTADIAVVGRHPFAEKLAKTVGADRVTFSGTAQLKKELWYVLDLSAPDLDELRQIAQRCSSENKNLLTIILLSNIKAQSVILRYAEMELLTVMDSELGEVRSILGESAKAVVLDRILGAEFDGVGLSKILKEADEKGTVTVTQDMAQRRISLLYLPDAISAVITVAAKGKPGNIYNATSFCLSEYELRSKIYMMLAPHGVKLNAADGDGKVSHAALSAGKLSSLGWESMCTLDEALRYTIPAYAVKYDLLTDYIRDSYDGKLAVLRRLQLDMLGEIDRICRKHGIKYFLSGGSMLGAARHGGYIPWDDDIDVAFLREEFEKFKAVAPAELDDRFSFQSYTNRDGYHFFFDRITAKDTYFASRYSDGYEMPKGISVDIFVYDNVPDSARAQRRHWKRLMRKRLLMNVRWKDEPRGSGAGYLVSKLLLPLLRLRTMDRYSEKYNRATRRYEKRTGATVMPPATDHNWHEPMPREWFTEVVPCTFEGVDTFLPVGWDGFLKSWYGDDYMTMLPLAKQQPYHDYYRLDVGSYVDEKSEKHFDFSGELK